MVIEVIHANGLSDIINKPKLMVMLKVNNLNFYDMMEDVNNRIETK